MSVNQLCLLLLKAVSEASILRVVLVLFYKGCAVAAETGPAGPSSQSSEVQGCNNPFLQGMHNSAESGASWVAPQLSVNGGYNFKKVGVSSTGVQEMQFWQGCTGLLGVGT